MDTKVKEMNIRYIMGLNNDDLFSLAQIVLEETKSRMSTYASLSVINTRQSTLPKALLVVGNKYALTVSDAGRTLLPDHLKALDTIYGVWTDNNTDDGPYFNVPTFGKPIAIELGHVEVYAIAED